LSYHGTAEHSMVLSPTQEAALAGVLRRLDGEGG
jgi:hypothetical protein